MKAVCDTCGARYRIPDEKAAGKVLQIRCRKCGNIFKFEGKTAPRRAHVPKGDWFFAIDGESFGPYTERELRTRFETGKLGLSTHVWKEGFSDWLPVVEHPEFAAAIELSKDNIRRLGAQRPQTSRTTDGSGRFTVDIRRPGATVDERTQDQRDALNDEVDDAFKSLLGHPSEREEPSDDFTPTKPMRMSATPSPGKAAADDTQAETLEATRPVTKAAAIPVKSARPSTNENIQAPVDTKDKASTTDTTNVPAKPAADAPPKRLSLSERLRLIREQSEGGGLPKPSTTSPASGLPTREVPKPAAKPAAKPETPRAESDASPILESKADENLFGGLGRTSDARDDEDTPLPSVLGVSDSPATEAPETDEPVAPIPSGPIRQVTQEIDVGDFFDAGSPDDIPAPVAAAPPVDVPSDEDLQAHLSKRKQARARGEQPSAAVSADEPPFVLPNDIPPKSPKISKSGASAPYRLDGTTDAYDDEPPYILDKPSATVAKDARITEHDITPVGGTAAVQTPTATDAQPSVEETKGRRRGLLILILLISLLILALIAGWLILGSDGEVTDVLPAIEDALESDAQPAVDPTDVMYARNRAIGIVAQSRSAAQSAAFVATEGERNAAQKRRLRHQSNRTPTSNNRALNTPIEFTTASSAGGRLGAQREAPSSGPSKALFADTLRGAVGRSVGRCAQRTLGVQGYLPVARLELSITINPDGAVGRVRGQREAHGGPLMKCITNESQRWRFPAFNGKATTISNAYVLQ